VPRRLPRHDASHTAASTPKAVGVLGTTEVHGDRPTNAQAAGLDTVILTLTRAPDAKKFARLMVAGPN